MQSFFKKLLSMVGNFYWDGSNLALIWKKPFNLVAERPIFHLAGPIDLDGELVEPEHWKTLLRNIYQNFISEPLLIPDSYAFSQ